jgi:hypothetical protein
LRVFCGLLDGAGAKKFKFSHCKASPLTRHRVINHNPLFILDYFNFPPITEVPFAPAAVVPTV